MDQYFSTREVAKICQVSRGSVIRWIHDGKLEAAVTPGGHHRIRHAHLVAFLNAMNMAVPAELQDPKAEKPAASVLLVADPSVSKDLVRLIHREFPTLRIETKRRDAA